MLNTSEIIGKESISINSAINRNTSIRMPEIDLNTFENRVLLLTIFPLSSVDL